MVEKITEYFLVASFVIIGFCGSLSAIAQRGAENKVVFRKHVVAAESDTATVGMLVHVSDLFLNVNSDSALHYAQRATQLAKQHRNDKEIADADVALGQALKKRGEYDPAFACFQRAHETYLAQENNEGMSRTLLLQGMIEKNRANYTAAHSFIIQSLTISEAHELSDLMADGYLSLGNVLKSQRDYRMALEYYEKSKAICENRGNILGVGKALQNIGNAYAEQDSAIQARTYFDAALVRYRQVDDLLGVAALTKNVGALYYKQGDFAAAKSYFLEAAKAYQAIGNLEKSAPVENMLGVIFLDEGQPEVALPHLKQALAHARASGDKSQIQIEYENISNAYEAMGDYKSALAYEEKFIAIKDTIYDIARHEQSAELQAQYETEKKEKEAAQAKAELAEAEKRTSRFLLIAAVAGLLAILMIVISLYLRQRQVAAEKLAAQQKEIDKQQINELLRTQELQAMNAMIEGEEQERKRVAQDLHDRLGSMLSTVKLLFSSIELNKEEVKKGKQEQYEKATHLLDDACQEVRQIAHNMVSGILSKYGLIAALRDLGDTLTTTDKIAVKVLAFGIDERLPKNIETTVYRIVQEMVSNILKHAQATEIIIQLNLVDDVLNVTVEDDGKGFDPSSIKMDSGMGLGNIKMRVEKLQGTFDIDSVMGTGTTMMAEIPLQEVTQTVNVDA